MSKFGQIAGKLFAYSMLAVLVIIGLAVAALLVVGVYEGISDGSLLKSSYSDNNTGPSECDNRGCYDN